MFSSKFKSLSLSAALLCLSQSAFADSQAKCTAQTPQPSHRTLLFSNGDMGSHFWRIPALATTNSGVVIAAADKRNDSNQDLPNRIDIAIRRSSDSGRTWTPQQLVFQADSIGGYGDAALGVHRPSGEVVMVLAHGNGVWEATPEERQYVCVSRSSDDGKTWSEPVDITNQLYSPFDGEAPVKAYSGFASSGTMLCDDNGRLWFVLVARTNERKWSPLDCFVCYSDDGGRNWNINPTPIDRNGDESKIVQLPDGSYLVSMRNRNKGERKFMRSADGITWTPAELQPDLVDPGCNGDLIAVPASAFKNAPASADGTILVHSLANDPEQRRNVSVFASGDDGHTWTKIATITPFGSAYSALTLLPDGNLGCFSEEDSTEGGYRLWFSRLPLP